MKIFLLIGVALCSGCSLLFAPQEASQDAGSSAVDANVGAPTATILIQNPGSCSANVYRIGGLSTAAEGTFIEEHRWAIRQGDNELARLSGPPADEVAPSTHLRGGTLADFGLNPSLFSAPQMLSATGFNSNDFKQVFQVIPSPLPEMLYEISFVAASSAESDSFRVDLLEHTDSNSNLGLNETITPTLAPELFTFVFEAEPAATTQARVRFAFNTPGSFSIDNVHLRQIDSLGGPLTNGGFDNVALDGWANSFPNGALASAENIPAFFPPTTLTLVAKDSIGRESVTAEVTLESPPCP